MFNKNIYGQCAKVIQNTNGEEIDLDIGLFLQRILLFEEYTLGSIRLKELPILAKYIGIDGLKTLLEHESIKIHCQPLTMGQIGQTTAIASIAKKGALPLFSYNFQLVTVAHYEQYLEQALKELKKIENITRKQLKKLKQLVRKKLVFFQENTKTDICNAFEKDLLHDNLVYKTICSFMPIGSPCDKLKVKTIRINEEDWKVDTNVCLILGLDALSGHKMVEQALLSLGGLERRIHEMRDFDTLSGFRDDREFDIFKEKLKPIGDKLSENQLNENFIKILDIKEFPNFAGISQKENFDIEKLLKLKDTSECKEFRDWLWSLKDTSEQEIKDRVGSLRSKIGNSLTTKTGKTIRFAVNTIAGFLHPASMALGATDTFLAEKIFKRDGVAAFINQMYPSLFN